MGIKGLAKLLSDEAPDVSFRRFDIRCRRLIFDTSTCYCIWKFQCQ
jgi:hypothetical protein